MNNNTPHSLIAKQVKQPRFYTACCFVLLSSTSIASAQDMLTSPSFPRVPQLSSSNTVLPEVEAQDAFESSLPEEVVAPNQSTEYAAGSDIIQTAVVKPKLNTSLLATASGDNRPPSYGSWPKSLMFPEKEIQYMKTILDEYEATGEVPLSLQDLPDTVIFDKEPTVDITEYPSFHLKSILYHSPKFWGIWINDIKITSRDNHTSDAEIKVVNVSKENVRFKWKPSDPTFMNTFVRQLPNLKEIAADTVLPIVNRTSRSARQATISEDKTTLYFSLRLNESFSTETFYTFDGKPPTLVYPSLDTPYSIDSKVAPATAQISPNIAGNARPSAPANLDETLSRIAAKKAEASSPNDNTDKMLDQQSPKELLESMTPEAALEALTPEQAREVIQAITN